MNFGTIFQRHCLQNLTARVCRVDKEMEPYRPQVASIMTRQRRKQDTNDKSDGMLINNVQ
jgi:hypothetical protein